MKKQRGHFITKCKKGSGIQITTPEGTIIYFTIIKSGPINSEIIIKAPSNVQIKKID